ncbi:MCE family protein [Rhodococcus erythropolis]|uniref:MCE family protein n=1 Tax=Rhodococcus erythropolis TaxID=1833 RepID=UPI001E4B0369|nr:MULTISPECIES: MCE family protein [Rhodococcus erythropolis group]MCD2107132.1 MCE family protein [Rhodococcus qingshengii]MCZ4526561.1 MCE family protein [Rhodococcus erythropolis]
MTNRHRESRTRNACLGAALVALVLVLTAASIGLYNGAFTSTAKVVIRTDRTGLMMDTGSDVKMNGKVVGRVASTSYSRGNAVITMEMQPDQLVHIPRNVDVQLNATTLFARKYVNLVAPEYPSRQKLTNGDAISNTEVTVEVESILGNLMSVLDQVDPAQVNTVLAQAATALNGRGSDLGSTLEELNEYLVEFNGSIPTLQRDISLLADNAATFADLSPDLLSVLDNTSVTGTSLTDKQTQLSAFLVSFTGLGNSGRTLLDAAGQPLVQAVHELNPVLDLFAEYSPEYQCLFAGLTQSDRYLTRVLGGGRPGLNILGTIPMGDPFYQFPGNLPQVGNVTNAPSCYGMQDGVTTFDPGHTNFQDGSDAYQVLPNPLDDIGGRLASLLFGHQK